MFFEEPQFAESAGDFGDGVAFRVGERAGGGPAGSSSERARHERYLAIAILESRVARAAIRHGRTSASRGKPPQASAHTYTAHFSRARSITKPWGRQVGYNYIFGGTSDDVSGVPPPRTRGAALGGPAWGAPAPSTEGGGRSVQRSPGERFRPASRSPPRRGSAASSAVQAGGASSAQRSGRASRRLGSFAGRGEMFVTRRRCRHLLTARSRRCRAKMRLLAPESALASDAEKRQPRATPPRPRGMSSWEKSSPPRGA